MAAHDTWAHEITHYMILEVSWDGLWTLLWALTISWSRLFGSSTKWPLGVVYIMDHKVVPCQMAFFHGHTSMVNFMQNGYFKALGLSLDETECEPKGMTIHRKVDCPCVCTKYPKLVVLGIFLRVSPSPFLPFFPLHFNKFFGKNPK
jgi:hypothetical protein